MALTTFVKVGQLTNLSDARYCAGMGVALLGFNTEPGTVHYVDPEKFREISEWVAGVAFAAEFKEASAGTIERLLPEYPVDYIQTDRADQLEALEQLELPLILRLYISETTDVQLLDGLLQQHAHQVAYFLLETAGDAPLSAEVLAAIHALSKQYPLLSALQIEAATVLELLERYPLGGIALQGGVEIKTGFKTFDEMAEVLEVLEVDEAY
ncbi:phosphoribosylanthranilate isomerase [Cesiribacter andamanensis]|uniref:phosphoribosylanthranilate isomerase n=1 Tax=Cesiribacter andamanensis AMV16 TaxID=1279009 RepID=M7N2I9_9BACT|nr:N-(5'-phosphoribosyl)anthranilate isomerase [Cesiribacter andamanensis]EMR02883.1 N-(5'-phosphoribosyl)anthranilate isomerase [Cesiribacter andamanensis AMV16]